MANRVSTLTNTKLIPKVVDTVLDSNVFATRMLMRAQRWSGEKIRKAVKISTNTNNGSFDGFDQFNATAQDTRRAMEFEAKFFHQDVVLPLTETSKNMADPSRIADLAAMELASAAEDMADKIGTQFYGDGTGNGGKDFLGLEGIVDDGTNLATYGGLSRTTFPTLKSTVTGSGGTLTLAKMDTMWDSVTSGGIKPTVIICDQTLFSLYGQLRQPSEQIIQTDNFMGGMKAGAGPVALGYRGVPVIADEKATAGTMYFLNENFLEWRALPMDRTMPANFNVQDIEGNDYTNVKGLGFSWSDWIIPSNQASIIGHIYLGGQLWSSNPRRQGKLTGITTV